MTEQNLEELTPQQPPKAKKTWRIVRWLIIFIISLILLLVVSLFALASSDRGSEWLLEFAMDRQKMVSYRYEKGNLLQGIIVKDIHVNVKDVEVKVAHADINLGWRAIVNKEIHLTHLEAGVVQVINHAPPKDEEFQFKPIKLPFVLRLDDAKIDQLVIQNPKSQVIFKDIQAYDAVWSGTKIELTNSSMDMGYLNAKKINGYIQLDGKYPLNIKGDVTIPALKSLNITEIKLNAKGSLDRLHAGVATVTPDILSGYAVVHPLRKNVPMQAKLSWQKFNWPLLVDQKLYSEAGFVDLSGDIQKLTFNVDTDLIGKNIPQGNYQAVLNTDLKQLNIEDFQGSLMQGQVHLAGVLGWQKGVVWDVKGSMKGINPQDKNIPEVVQQFLPPDMSGELASKGNLDQGTDIVAIVDFAKYEKWNIHLKQALIAPKKKQPLLMTVAWQGINRQLPYIGWLNSVAGDVDLALSDQGQDIRVVTAIEKHEQSTLPAGKYAATFNFAKNVLDIKDFSLSQAEASQLLGHAKLYLPTEKTNLKWTANLVAKQFNPQSILASAPVNQLDGKIQANGYAEPNKQIIHLNGVDLTGQLAQGNTTQNVGLTGKSTIAVLLHDGKQQSGLKGYAVEYQGQLNASNYTQGPLVVKLSGTPSLIKVAQLYHQGAAGKIDVNGLVNFNQGVLWDLRANFNDFKPNYFVSQLSGNITGNFNTQGKWSEKDKSIAIQNLNLQGLLNNKRLFGKGNLALDLNAVQNLKLKNTTNNNLILSYANNIVQVTNDATAGLKLNIKAENLNEIYAGLHGAIRGAISLQTQPELLIKSKLIAENLGYGNVFNIQKASLIGTLPTSSTTSSQLNLDVSNAASGERKIGDLNIKMLGMKSAHVMHINAGNKVANFALKLAGGVNAQGDWLGQFQDGVLKSLQSTNKMYFKQNVNANIVFRKQQKSIVVTPHCWFGQNTKTRSEFCFIKPVVASAEQGDLSIGIKSIDLSDFQGFLPNTFALTGQLGGYTNLSWQTGKPMQLDAQLVSRQGTVGLVSEDANHPIAFEYQSVRLIAKTLAEGLSINLKADTPLLGSGFADVVIGHDAQKSINGLVAVNGMRLDLLKPFIADLRVLNGQLSMAGRVSGALVKPQFNGEIRLKDGAVALTSVPLDLQKIQLSAAINNNLTTIAGRFNAGSGEGKLTGTVDLTDSPKIDLALEGSHLQVLQPPLVRAEISPKLKVAITPANKRLKVDGFIGVPVATIAMPETSTSAINISSDVRIVDSRRQHEYIAAARPWNIEADIVVQLNKNLQSDPEPNVADRKYQRVIFRAFNSTIPLTGRLRLNQKGTEIALRANGILGVSRQVIIEAFGQRLDLDRAIVRFNGELSNPNLDIEASKNVQNSTIRVSVTGGATRPNIQILNDAGLSEQEATNALLTGRISAGSSGMNNAEGFKSDVNNTITAAGISMGLGGTRAFTNQIGRTFGLSGLALDAQGSGDDTQVSVTGYITPDLYLRYGVGIFTPVNTLTLRYQMNRRLYVEATSSLERAVDLFYNWRF